jgi:RNA polymerase sigma-70 factor (sigma-E family)
MTTSHSLSPTPDGGATRDGAAAYADAASGVTALYAAHAVGLIRLAIVMLGERTAAEDVVQDAFLGLYRNWDRLADQAKALSYARSAVLNGCRNVLRVRNRPERMELIDEATESAEATALVGAEHQRVLTAIRALPNRQREAMVLRHYLDLTVEETAAVMGISQGTVKSATSRAVAALARLLKEEA